MSPAADTPPFRTPFGPKKLLKRPSVIALPEPLEPQVPQPGLPRLPQALLRCDRHRQLAQRLRGRAQVPGAPQAVLRGQQGAQAEAHEEPGPKDIAPQLHVTADEQSHGVHPVLVAHERLHLKGLTVEI